MAMGPPITGSKNIVDDLEDSFERCINLLMAAPNANIEEIQSEIDQSIMPEFMDIARKLEDYFLQKRILISAHKPELLVKERTEELKAELVRKEDFLKKHYQKVSKWQQFLEDIQLNPNTLEKEVASPIKNTSSNTSDLRNHRKQSMNPYFRPPGALSRPSKVRPSSTITHSTSPNYPTKNSMHLSFNPREPNLTNMVQNANPNYGSTNSSIPKNRKIVPVVPNSTLMAPPNPNYSGANSTLVSSIPEGRNLTRILDSLETNQNYGVRNTMLPSYKQSILTSTTVVRTAYQNQNYLEKNPNFLFSIPNQNYRAESPMLPSINPNVPNSNTMVPSPYQNYHAPNPINISSIPKVRCSTTVANSTNPNYLASNHMFTSTNPNSATVVRQAYTSQSCHAPNPSLIPKEHNYSATIVQSVNYLAIDPIPPSINQNVPNSIEPIKQTYHAASSMLPPIYPNLPNVSTMIQTTKPIYQAKNQMNQASSTILPPPNEMFQPLPQTMNPCIPIENYLSSMDTFSSVDHSFSPMNQLPPIYQSFSSINQFSSIDHSFSPMAETFTPRYMPYNTVGPVGRHSSPIQQNKQLYNYEQCQEMRRQQEIEKHRELMKLLRMKLLRSDQGES